MQALNFDINGMTCGGCTGSVKRVLSKLDGVSQVEVSLTPGSATVQMDPSRVTAAGIQSAITSLGYKATLRPPDLAGDAMS